MQGRESEKRKSQTLCKCLAYKPKKMVGAVGFEPTASCSQGRRANQAALRPDS